MDIQAEKLALIQWLAGINDSRIIQLFQTLKQTTEATQAAQMTAAERSAVEKGLMAVEEGRTISHADAMQQTRAKFPKLFGEK